MLGGVYEEYIQKNNLSYDQALLKIKNNFQDNDIVFCNLENPIFKSSHKRPGKGAILSANKKSIEALKIINCNIVNIGNNHINDYGDEGLIKTKHYLEKNGFITLGAGENIHEALKPKIINIKDKKFGFLSFTTPNPKVNVTSIIATEKTAGCANFENVSLTLEKIKELRSKVDYLFVSLHWGYQLYYYPSPEQIKLAHKIIDAGADVIIGHHPHVIQPFENYNKAKIFYSLGNFFFPDFRMIDESMLYWKDYTRDSLIVKLNINKKGQIKSDLIPFRSNNFNVNYYPSMSEKSFLENISTISKKINTKNYDEFWENYMIKKRGRT